MISFYRKFIGIKHEIVWFSQYIPTVAALNFSDYRQCIFTERKLGFFRKKNLSIYIDLEKPLQSIFSDFNSNTRNEVRRAIRNDYQYKEIKELDIFIEFYNKFAENKKREKIDISFFRHFISYLHISVASSNDGVPLVMHSYLIDKYSGNARLLQSASHYRELADKNLRANIGIANRFLHYKDIEYFKENRYKIYDFGGISENQIEEEIKIAKFKKGFGGQEFYCADYLSILLWLAIKLKIILSYLKVKSRNNFNVFLHKN